MSVELLGGGDEDVVGEEVGGEVDVYLCAVVEAYAAGDDDGGAVWQDAHDGHAGAEEEEGDVVGGVEADYLGEDAEGGIVDDDAVLGVLGVLVVTAGVKGAEDFLVVEGTEGADVLEDGFVDVGGCVGVVGGLGVLFVAELGDVGFVVVEDDGVTTAASSCGSGGGGDGGLCVFHSVFYFFCRIVLWFGKIVISLR